MSGEELKKKVDALGFSQAEVARRLNVIPQSVTQYYKADDVKTGLLEDLSRVLEVDISYFYGSSENEILFLRHENEELKKEMNKLKQELARAKDPNSESKNSKIFKLWMKFMEITAEMQELYKEEKGE